MSSVADMEERNRGGTKGWEELMVSDEHDLYQTIVKSSVMVSQDEEGSAGQQIQDAQQDIENLIFFFSFLVLLFCCNKIYSVCIWT